MLGGTFTIVVYDDVALKKPYEIKKPYDTRKINQFGLFF